ncbi:MAG TPA: PAS domain S-box protein [Anaeromyxobacteraceae bacterium]|nr:PAS domain S-box protein [Anaeromyxobacteraceae bacterium]
MSEPRHDAAVGDDRYRRAFQAAPVGLHFYQLDPDDRLVLVSANEGADRILGVDGQHFVGRPIEEVFPRVAGTEMPARFREVALTGKPWTSDLVDYRGDEVAAALHVYAFPIGEREVGVQLLDVGARRQAEQALRRSEQRYRHLVENQQDLIVEADVDGRVRFASPSYCRLFGKSIEEVVGQHFMPLVHAEDRGATLQALEKLFLPPHTCTVEQRAMTPGGWRWLAWSDQAVLDENGEVVSIVAVGRDVTTQRAMEERLRQSEKLHAIGQLAGGVAHDFNNQLTGILSAGEILAQALKAEPELRELAEMVVTAAEHSTRLTRQLLAYARKGKLKTVPVDVHGTVQDVIALLRRSIDKRIAIRQALEARPSTTLGDSGQLHNALLNLALNARDAMPEGGELTFASRTVDLTRADVEAGRLDVVPGRYVALEVRDTGVGMDAETRSHLFEPFFTTKDVGKGSGLGLAAVYGTMKTHRGAVDVSSERGRGTAFTLYLPLVEPETRAADLEAVPAVEARRRILVVDDERVVRDVLRRLLERAGHHVLVADGAEEGLEIYRQSWHHLDLVIMDVMMPDMDGREALARMREVNPNVRAVLSSGYSVDAEGALATDGVRLLQKPYALEDVSRAIAEALAAPSRPVETVK